MKLLFEELLQLLADFLLWWGFRLRCRHARVTRGE